MVFHFGITRRFISTSSLNATIRNVTVIGAGQMGSGIAQIAAQTCHHVTVVDVNKLLLQRTQENISANLETYVLKKYKNNPNAGEKFKYETLSRLIYSTNIINSIKNADLILECIDEKIELKHKLFKFLDYSAPEKTIFASNTSSLTIAEIASVVKRKDKFGGLHFCFPVQVKKLLEVIRIKETTDATYDAMLEWGEKLGKVCIRCKDMPGFIVNGLFIPYLAEAMRMLERGHASASDIDTGMKLGAGFPLGPLEMADHIGLDTVYNILHGWYTKYPNCKLFKPPNILIKMVHEEKYGVKTGEGFHIYK